MSAPVVWQPLRDVIAEAIYMDPRDFPEHGENWPGRLDFPRWNDLSEEKRELWRQDADRAIAVLGSDAGCNPRMENAARGVGADNLKEILAAIAKAESR